MLANKNGNVYGESILTSVIKPLKQLHLLENFTIRERIGVGVYNPHALARLFPDEPYENMFCHPDICQQCRDSGQGKNVFCIMPDRSKQRVPRECPFVTEHAVMQDKLPQ